MTAAHLMKTYSPQPVAFARGEGAWLWDTEVVLMVWAVNDPLKA